MNGSERIFISNDIKFKIPSGMVIIGSSSSGKTTFLLRLLENFETMFDPVPREIVYAYGQYPKKDNYLPQLEAAGIIVIEGIPSEEFLAERAAPFLLILDDLMLSTNKKYLDELYTKRSHHENFSVIFITQNPFDKNLVTARQNAHYLILMRAPNASLQMKTLGVQLFPGSNYFMDSYKDATKNPYGYLVVNLHPSSPNELRLSTDIFNEAITIYLP